MCRRDSLPLLPMNASSPQGIRAGATFPYWSMSTYAVGKPGSAIHRDSVDGEALLRRHHGRLPHRFPPRRHLPAPTTASRTSAPKANAEKAKPSAPRCCPGMSSFCPPSSRPTRMTDLWLKSRMTPAPAPAPQCLHPRAPIRGLWMNRGTAFLANFLFFFVFSDCAQPPAFRGFF